MASPSELMRNPVIQTPTESGHATFDIRQRISRVKSAASASQPESTTASSLAKPALAGSLVPLREWLGRDLQGNRRIAERLEELLKRLQDEASRLAQERDDAQAREWVQMLRLAQQILQESCAKLSGTLRSLVLLSHALSGTEMPATSETNDNLDHWVVFSRCWQERPVSLLLANISLLGAVYGNQPQGERLLSFVAPHFKEPWRVYARFMLVVALENDAAMAQTIFRKQVEPFASSAEAKSLQQALQALEEVLNFRNLYTQRVFGNEAIKASDPLDKFL
jgi:hypothetical protein